MCRRFYEPQQGCILLDGRPIESFSLGEWSRAVAMVGQEPVLFSGTIADNIAYGRMYGLATPEVRALAGGAAGAGDMSRAHAVEGRGTAGGRGSAVGRSLEG